MYYDHIISKKEMHLILWRAEPMNYSEAEPRGIEMNSLLASNPEGRGIKPNNQEKKA